MMPICGLTISSYMPRLVALFTALLLLTWPVGSAEIDWDKAEREIQRLPPSVFTKLPSRIMAALEEQGCTIPQVYDEAQPSNVITGSFADPHQVDWAVLCSRNSKSSLLVFWGGPANCPPNPLEEEDRRYLQGIGGDAAGYSRQIRAIGRDKIIEFYFNVEGGKPLPPINHQAIEHLFVDKTSFALYCYHGVWYVLSGEGH